MILNKQSDYFDETMHKTSVRLDSVANLEKRLQLHVQSLDLVPQLQLNLQDIRDVQLPMLVEDLRKQMISKIEQAIKNHLTASIKADSVEQKMHTLQESMKKQATDKQD